MDVGYTYGTAAGARASIYAPPEFLVPEQLVLGDAQTRQGVKFHRLSDRALWCECGRFECHRAELGKCGCGKHEHVEINRSSTTAGERQGS